MIKIKDGFSGQRAFVLPPAYIRELEENPLSALLHITDIGYYPHAHHHFRQRLTPISQYIFIYCIHGTGWYEINGVRHTVHPDSYFILPPNIPHSYGADDNTPWSIYWIHFKGTMAHAFISSENKGTIEIKPDMKSKIRECLELFEEIMNTLDNGYSRRNLLYTCSVFHHFIGSLSYLSQFREAADKTGSAADLVALAIKYIKENIEKPLQLADIASHLGYSPSYFSSIFTQATGMAPISYMIQLKISRACSLLDFTNLRVNQICHLVGINDPYYFSRIFNKTMGMSPRKYRSIKKG